MQQDKYLFNKRIKFLSVLFGLFLVILISRLFWLQIYKNDFYDQRSEINSTRIEPLKPLRGIIYDRNKNVLAENRLGHSLVINIENKNREEIQEIISNLKKTINLSELDIEFFEKLMNQKKFLQELPIKANLTLNDLSTFVGQKYLHPNVELKEDFVRYYPESLYTSHLIGYINRISAADLKNIKENPELEDEYFGLTHIGKQGVEKSYEDILKGRSGFKKIRVDSRNSFVRDVEVKASTPGTNIDLTIDIILQKKAFELLKKYKGAIILTNVESNEILAYQSLPSFDPNLFVNGISHVNWNKLLQDPTKPLLDRVIGATYPPGSTIKPFIALSGLENKIINKTSVINDPGFYTLPKTKKVFRDWKKEGHGRVDLITAIAESCDVYFYDLGFNLGIRNIAKTLEQFNFGSITSIPLPSEKSGILPSPEWKQKYKKKKWYSYETINTSIGQGDFLVTPLQLVNALNTLLNNRQLPKPKITLNDDDKLLDSVNEQVGSSENINLIKQGMIEVTQENGTFRSISSKNPNKLAGKTGTAQVFSLKNQDYNEDLIEDDLKDHSLFIGFAPYDKPIISIAVVIENGGHGSTAAAPVAKELVDFYFKYSNE